jgi:cyclic pyranopterin phosphate synthase
MHAQKSNPRIVYWMGNTLYLNVTNRCSNDCYFCFRKFKNGIREFDLKLKNEPTFNEVQKELREVINKKKWNEVVFCGFGEPLERLDLVLEVTRWLKKRYVKTIRVDTNGHGYLLNPGREVELELKDAGLDKISVSLNASDRATYNKVCKPSFENAYENVLESINKSLEAGLETEVTAVTVSEVDIQKVKDLTEKMGVKFSERQYISFFW